MARLTLQKTSDQLDYEWVVEREGAEVLSFRLAQQAQWNEAGAVRDGHQPPSDPDGAELEEIDDGVRIYRLQHVPGTMDGRPAILSQRLVKRLENGHWEGDLEVDCYRYADLPSALR